MDAMAAAFLLAAYQGTDLSANRQNVSVIALVEAGLLNSDLRPTPIGEIGARRTERDFGDWYRSLDLLRAQLRKQGHGCPGND